MKRSREEFLVCDSLRAAGVDVDQKMEKAVSEGLKRIRQEKYDARVAQKQRTHPVTRPGA